LSTAEKPPALTKTASSAKNVNEGSMDAARRRALDVVLEDGAMRNPVSGLFKALKVVPSLETALSEIGKKYPNLSPHDGVMVAMARQQFRQCMGREGVPASLTADEGAAIVLYTMEDIPREDSLYFVLNAALRSKDRKTVALWRDFIWLLMHALRKLPQPTERMLYRGLKVEPGERQPSTKEGSQQWSGFSSTSARAEVMRTFLGDSGERYLYNIEMIEPSARDIRAFSLYPDENEILLPPNFCFDIVSVYPAGDGLTLLQCKQTRTLDKILDFGEPPASWGVKSYEQQQKEQQQREQEERRQRELQEQLEEQRRQQLLLEKQQMEQQKKLMAQQLEQQKRQQQMMEQQLKEQQEAMERQRKEQQDAMERQRKEQQEAMERQRREQQRLQQQKSVATAGAMPLPPQGKWSGGGRNKAMLGVSYSINFYFTIQANGSDRAWIEGVAVPPTALEGFRRIRVRGEIDRSTNSARLEHPGKGGYTNCRFFKEGSGWRMTAEWYLPPDMSLIGGHLIPYNGTHDVSFTGDTRTTPGGVGLF